MVNMATVRYNVHNIGTIVISSQISMSVHKMHHFVNRFVSIPTAVISAPAWLVINLPKEPTIALVSCVCKLILFCFIFLYAHRY